MKVQSALLEQPLIFEKQKCISIVMKADPLYRFSGSVCFYSNPPPHLVPTMCVLAEVIDASWSCEYC